MNDSKLIKLRDWCRERSTDTEADQLWKKLADEIDVHVNRQDAPNDGQDALFADSPSVPQGRIEAANESTPGGAGTPSEGLTDESPLRSDRG